MATRKHLSHDEKTRQRIQTSQLLNRLTDNAFGKIELTREQIRSIDILLKKSLPDLSSVQVTGDPTAPLLHEIRRTVVRP